MPTDQDLVACDPSTKERLRRGIGEILEETGTDHNEVHVDLKVFEKFTRDKLRQGIEKIIEETSGNLKERDRRIEKLADSLDALGGFGTLKPEQVRQGINRIFEETSSQLAERRKKISQYIDLFCELKQRH